MEEIFQVFNNLKFNWSFIECLAVLSSVIYVVLAAKENIWCWLAAFISVSLYTYICYTSQLYPETGLQIFYLIMAIVGYLMWDNKDNRKIKEWTVSKHLFTIFIGTIITFLSGYYFTNFTDSVMPVTDSFTTVFSIIATYMLVKKVLGNWLYWIIIDIVSVYIYFNRDLHLTSLLFMIYSLIAISGYVTWIKRMKKDV